MSGHRLPRVDMTDATRAFLAQLPGSGASVFKTIKYAI